MFIYRTRCNGILLFICFAVICFVCETKAGNDYYYWKDFYGIIPEDALKAGKDSHGRTTYIGQTYFSDKNHLLPTIITEGEKTAFIIVGNQKWIADKRTKILCSTNNALFRWIPASTSRVHYMTRCRQIEGGWSPNDIVITIGRANHQGATITGRVYDNNVHKLHGLWIYENTNEKIVPEFQVLVYDCNTPFTEDDPNIK